MSENISFLDRLIAWMGSVQSLMVHTGIFVCSFGVIGMGVAADKVFLVLTTAVSLEAIYLSLLIQMSVNKASASIEEIQEDIEDIQEDVEEISDDLEELSDDIEEISDDIEEIQEDLDEEETTIDATHTDTLHQILHELAAIREEMRELKK